MATGRRKEAVARVRLRPGNGVIVINGRPDQAYFDRETLSLMIRQPLEAVGAMGKFDVVASVVGGGTAGQAGAIRHGIARALLELDATHRGPLRQGGYLTRDSRAKERKKYGQRGARRKFQWTKR